MFDRMARPGKFLRPKNLSLELLIRTYFQKIEAMNQRSMHMMIISTALLGAVFLTGLFLVLMKKWGEKKRVAQSENKVIISVYFMWKSEQFVKEFISQINDFRNEFISVPKNTSWIIFPMPRWLETHRMKSSRQLKLCFNPKAASRFRFWSLKRCQMNSSNSSTHWVSIFVTRRHIFKNISVFSLKLTQLPI